LWINGSPPPFPSPIKGEEILKWIISPVPSPLVGEGEGEYDSYNIKKEKGGEIMGSVVKKRRKKMRKHKHKKQLDRDRHKKKK
jgi:hypothetical protein